MITIDDSGLEVDAIGKNIVYTHLDMQENATDAKIEKLVKALKNTPASHRGGRLYVVYVVFPDGKEFVLGNLWRTIGLKKVEMDLDMIVYL